MRTCKVCGKEYPWCSSFENSTKMFRWQNVACCVEHGGQYFAEVLRSRGEDIPDVVRKMLGESTARVDTSAIAEEDPYEFDDNLFEEDEDDEYEFFVEDEDTDE